MKDSGWRRGLDLRMVVRCWVLRVALVMAAWAGCATAESVKPRVIVFVHGLHGDRETWRAANGAYWPDMVRSDPHFQQSDVVVAEYPTPSSRGQYSTVQLAQMLFQQLAQKHVWEHREVVIVAHSLGGVVSEQMLLNHPAEASRVVFLLSYATPHQGSFIASLAKLYDSDPLLTDLSSSDDNQFLIDLEQRWRGTPAVAKIHRYCAYEGMDTTAGEGVGKYLHAHSRVVTYYSATFGCDADTAPQRIMADHIGIVKPASRTAEAYTYFAKMYANNPVINVVDAERQNKVTGLYVACNRDNASPDLQVPIELDPALHEQLMAATAEYVDTDKVSDQSSVGVDRVDPRGIAHISYDLKGKGHGLLGGCPTGHAAILVHFKVESRVPVRE